MPERRILTALALIVLLAVGAATVADGYDHDEVRRLREQTRTIDQLIARRGVRLDEQRRGHGLGLAIVADIVGQYGGTLAFDRSLELGGLRVTVHLPHGDRSIIASCQGATVAVAISDSS